MNCLLLKTTAASTPGSLLSGQCQGHLVVEMVVSQKWTSSTHVGGIFWKHLIEYFNFLNVQFTSVLTAYLTAIIDFSQLTSILSSLVSIDQILMQVAKSCYSLADYNNEINQFLSDIGVDFKFNYLALCFVKSHLKVIQLWNMRKSSHNLHTFK